MNFSFTKYMLITLTLVIFLTYCGKSPSDPPEVATGALRIAAAVDTNLVDSISVQLNNSTLGKFPNPCIIPDLVIGQHQVAVSKEDPADSLVDFNCSPRMVEIEKDDTTQIDVLLTKLAPDFILKNLNQKDMHLQNFRGQVVFLMFFSYT
jgi:hypothetical protein